MSEETVYLRSLEATDFDRLFEWHNSPELYRWLVGHFRRVNRSTEKAWLESKMQTRADELNLAICVSETQAHIGNLYLRSIDPVNRHAELHLFIADPSQRSRGFGASAVRQLLGRAWDEIGLQRVYLYVLASNEAAIRLYQKCSFMSEGILRRHAFKQGRFVDVLVMGTLK